MVYWTHFQIQSVLPYLIKFAELWFLYHLISQKVWDEYLIRIKHIS